MEYKRYVDGKNWNLPTSPDAPRALKLPPLSTCTIALAIATTLGARVKTVLPTCQPFVFAVR